MKTKKVLLRVFDEYAVCDDCNEILFEDNSILQRGKVTYTCPKCRKHYYLDERYPKRLFEKVGQTAPLTK